MPHPRLTRRAAIGAALALAVPPARAEAPRRIVSLGGAVTEILYRLGRDASVVGVDATSLHPAEALGTKPNVGYLRALGAEGLLSLRPDLVLAMAGAGPPDALRLVAEAGVRIVRVPEEPSEAGVLARIARVAEAVEAGPEGQALAAGVEEGFAALARLRAALPPDRVRVLAILSIQNGRPLVAGRGTTGDAILRLAGAANAVGDALEGWKPLSDEGVVAARPEALLVLSRGPGEPAPDPFALPAFAATPAARERRLLVRDGLALLGFGPRAPDAARELLAALHPGARGGAPEARAGALR